MQANVAFGQDFDQGRGPATTPDDGYFGTCGRFVFLISQGNRSIDLVYDLVWPATLRSHHPTPNNYVRFSVVPAIRSAGQYNDFGFGPAIIPLGSHPRLEFVKSWQWVGNFEFFAFAPKVVKQLVGIGSTEVLNRGKS